MENGKLKLSNNVREIPLQDGKSVCPEKVDLCKILCSKCKGITEVTADTFKALADRKEITVLGDVWRNDGMMVCDKCKAPAAKKADPMFESYEMQKVGEFIWSDGQKVCEPVFDHEGTGKYISIFWTVYGRCPDGTVEAIADRSNEDDAIKLFDFFNATLDAYRKVI